MAKREQKPQDVPFKQPGLDIFREDRHEPIGSRADPCKVMREVEKEIHPMVPTSRLINNENGSVIVVALLLLVFLTIIGITAGNNSRIELNVTRNSQIYKRDFYAAESGWQLAAKELQGFGLNYPTYPGGRKDFAFNDGVDNDSDGTTDEATESDGSLKDIDFAYEIDYLMDTKSAGNSGNCRDVIFRATSRALQDGVRTQEVETRLSKLCCGSYN